MNTSEISLENIINNSVFSNHIDNMAIGKLDSIVGLTLDQAKYVRDYLNDIMFECSEDDEPKLYFKLKFSLNSKEVWGVVSSNK